MRFHSLIVLSVFMLQGCFSDKKAIAERNMPAPEIAAIDTDGNGTKIADLKGKTVLMSFWFSGCGPCSAELPILDDFQDDAKDNNIKIVVINMRDSERTVQNTARRLGLTMPMYLDPLSITSKRYAVTGAPTNFIIGKDGIILRRIDGPINDDFLYKDLIEISTQGQSQG